MAIIDGKQIAALLRTQTALKVEQIKQQHQVTPGIATIIVGDDPASLIYVNRKYLEATKIGIKAEIIKMPADIAEERLLGTIEGLNLRGDIHAILLQLPLPKHLDKFKIINSIRPEKDVDGLTAVNAGKVALGRMEGCIFPCTPQGCMALARSVTPNLYGKNALVIGKSNLVGKPLSDMLLYAGCTVTIAHSATQNLAMFSKTADLVFVAAGVPGLMRGDMLKPGVVVVDVGISRVDQRLVGDCDFESCSAVASFITPVPGGVGPMTIAYLLHNTVVCCSGFCATSQGA